MSEIADGSEPAFAVLVSRHQKRILNLIYRFIGDRNQAEDLAQDVFLRIWQSAKSYKVKAKFTTWSYRITANLCLDALKSAHNKPSFVNLGTSDRPQRVNNAPQDLKDAAPSPEERYLTAEENSAVLKALHSLPTNQRLAVILCKFDGLSYIEIGSVLGCTTSAVESLLIRAKRSLRDKLLPAGKNKSAKISPQVFATPIVLNK